MPTRKQRRRRDKDRRHDYEYVLVDEEGREVQVDPAENGAAPARPAKQAPKRNAAAARGAGREIQPPSLRRLGKRALIVTPLMFATVYILSGDELTTAQKLMQTAFLLAVFLPFSYVMDSMTYRMWRRRNAPVDGGSQSRKA